MDLNEEIENGNPEEEVKKSQTESDESSGSDSSQARFGARRRRQEKLPGKTVKSTVDKIGRGKVLIFSSSQNLENGRSRAKEGSRGRGRDHEDGANYSRNKNYRTKTYDTKVNESTDSEDGRIGRQLRLLSRETDEDVVTKICQQLQEAFLLQDNLRYIRYNLIAIGNSLMDAYKLITSHMARQSISIAIARLGFVSDHDFNSFAKWILSSYRKEVNEKTCCSIMDAVTEMLKLHDRNPRLKNIDTILLPGLQSALESADTPDLFEAALNPVLLIAVKDQLSFLPYFRDTVDILVGWFIDPSQPAKVIRAATKALQLLRPFWKEDLSFSKTLLSQFLEDLDAFVADTNNLLEVTETSPEETNLTESLRKISSLLNVFVVVGAQVCLLPETTIYSPEFLNGALTKVSQSTLDLVLRVGPLNQSKVDGNALDDVIQFANDCSSLLIRWLGNRITPETAKTSMDLVQQLVGSSSSYEYPLLMSTIQLMTCLAEQHVVASVLPQEAIQSWMELSSWLIRSSQSGQMLGHVARLLRAVIKVKNVTLLIEVYRSLAAEINRCFVGLRQEYGKVLSTRQLMEENALLYLSPLADLGRSSSLVGMWALDPSLLELLAGQLRPVENIRFLSDHHPTLLQGVLTVLHSHAKSHGHFVANSCLLVNSTSVAGKNVNILLPGCQSPTSGNLSLILNLLTDLCRNLTGTARSSHSLVLQWCTQLLDTCRPCIGQLMARSDLFVQFLSSSIDFCGGSARHHHPLAVHSLLSSLVQLPDVTKETDLTVSMAQICIQQLRDDDVRHVDDYVHLLGRFPPPIVRQAAGKVRNELLTSVSLVSWVNNETAITNRASQQFFDFILKGVAVGSYESIYGFYKGSYSQQLNNKTSCNRPSSCDLPLWLAVQSALLCVNSKLRTPLGKAQDTFLAIEEAIKSAAGRPAGQEENVTEEHLAKLARVRLLLSFYEMLDKFMSNAFDGCSVALPLAPKATRVFFRTNQTTCQEWVNRMALPALTTSMRVGRYASAARFGLHLLTQWSATRRPVDPAELANVVHQVIESLIHLKGSQPIRGLATWMTAAQQADYFQPADIHVQLLEAAALQADSKFEDAIRSYTSIQGQPSPFICNQMIESYTALADWQAYQQWKDTWTTDGPTGPTSQMADLMKSFDSNVTSQVQWPDKTGSSIPWSAQQLIHEAQTGLSVAADRIRSARSVFLAPGSTWNIVQYFARSNCQLAATGHDDVTWPLLPVAHALSYANESAYLWMEHTRSVLKSASSCQLDIEGSQCGKEWSRWIHWYVGLDRQATEMTSVSARVDLSIVPQARVEGNVRLAERQLLLSLTNTASSSSQTAGSHDLATLLMNEALRMKLTDVDNARLAVRRQFEGAKLLHQKGETDAAISVLTQCSLALSRSTQSDSAGDQTILTHMAESYTLLAKWLQQSLVTSSSSTSAGPFKNMATLKELANCPEAQDPAQLISPLMERASQFCPSSSEAWLAWGHYQYETGQQQLNMEPLLSSVLPAKDIQGITSDELNGQQTDQKLNALLAKKPALLKKLLTDINNRRASAILSYDGALRAFFCYLNLQGSGSSPSRPVVDVTLRVLHIFSRHLVRPESSQDVIAATERTPTSAWRSITPQLLSLMQHGRQAWLRSLSSQLLARLAMEWPQGLVFPVAVGAAGLAFSEDDMATSTAYPSMEGLTRSEEADSDVVTLDCSAGELKKMYEKMLSQMTEQVPDMVNGVTLLLVELRRLVLLWDELWVAVLQQLHPQVEQLIMKHTSQSHKMNKKTTGTTMGLNETNKKDLMDRHFQVLFKPILLVLEAVARVTNVTPQTPHEIWFHQRYSQTINDGIADLKNFSQLKDKAVNELWMPFKNMLQQLQHINYRRSLLKLDDVSPALKQMKDTKIPMPGVDDQRQMATLFIRSIDNVVVVLPTKTKPKKFVFVGSNGKRYAYLFKGMEDLHLDQRIMQILSLANVLLQTTSATGSTIDGIQKRNYRARHYGVIPLGPRSGLIQWVDGVTPLFALYKRWLQRQATYANTQAAKGETVKDNAGGVVPRPSELFYNKLTPLLEAEGLSADPRQRHHWPLEILRRVLDQLMEETPKDLISRELWTGSLNAEQWWSSTQRFGQSCAVTSVIGYVIGLGDRHLDNVLVDLRCGEVVHIDYNVCFEKGRQLRVPENVPFRMTANLQHALGPAGTGLEGTFRLSCIDVMQVIRDHRQLFQILLEHFVYDPLIDWKSPNASSTTESSLIPLYVVDPALASSCSKQKRAAETDATFQLFQLRMSELGPEWLSNRDHMVSVLSSLKDVTSCWTDTQARLKVLQEEIMDLHQDRLVLFDIRSDKNHVMRQADQLKDILLPLRTAWQSEKSSRMALKTMVEDNSKWTRLYSMAFDSLKSGQLKRWADELSSVTTAGAPPESNLTGFPIVSDFLTSSGQSSLAQQGQLLEEQVRSLSDRQQVAATVVVNLLASYSSLAVHYPKDHLENHRTHLFSTWTNDLLENMATDTCQRMVSSFQDRFNPESASFINRQQSIVDFNLSLRRLLNEATMRLHQTSLQLTDHVDDSDLVIQAQEILRNSGRAADVVLLDTIEQMDKELKSAASCDAILLACGHVCSVAEAVMTGQDHLISSGCGDEILAGLKSVQQLLETDLQEFILHGTTIVLPELIRLFECSDDSVTQLHEELQVLCIDLNLSKMEMTRLRFQDLLGEGSDQQVQLTQAQMVLLCLNGLFEKVENGLVRLSHQLHAMTSDPHDSAARDQLLPEWFDQLEETLMAQRLTLIVSLFQSCADWAEGFQTGQISRQLQQDSFVDKFDRMAATWAVDFLSGAASFFLGRLSVHLVSTQPNDEVSDTAVELVGNVAKHWRAGQMIKLARQRQEVDQSLVQLLQQQLTAHSWLHDTMAGGGLNSPSAVFLINLQQSVSVLLSLSPQLADIHQQVTGLAGQVEQRLKWASGVDGRLLDLMTDFHRLQDDCAKRLQTYSSLATGLGSVSSAVLHYETYRTKTAESLAADSTFVQLLSQCQDVCLLKDCGTNGRLTDGQVRLAQRITIGEDGATEDWINLTEKYISDEITKSKETWGELQSTQGQQVEEMRHLNVTMRSHLAVHHQLISDVRSVLKLMAKCETDNRAGGSGPLVVTDYLDKYRQFSECCSSVSRHLTSSKDGGDMTVKMDDIRAEIATLQSMIDDIYHGLGQLCQVVKANGQQISTKKSTNEVNAFAASVWHRVRLKLEGKDGTDSDHQLTVEQQVDGIIEEATSLDNLALLYEGWTPWV